jgi:hypothetical protein
MRIPTVPYPSLINPIHAYADGLSRFVASTLEERSAAQVFAFARTSLVLLGVQLPHA